jgi:putative acetyltransferase
VENSIQAEDPGTDDVRALIERHLDFNGRQSPPEDVHALDVAALRDPALTFFALRRDGELLAVGALKRLTDDHVELKSMHTAESARRTGIGRAMLQHLLAVARQGGYARVSLETGSMEAFAPARALYASEGFQPCEPIPGYGPSVNSMFMTLDLTKGPAGRAGRAAAPGSPGPTAERGERPDQVRIRGIDEVTAGRDLSSAAAADGQLGTCWSDLSITSTLRAVR